jgi:hypothetical protein
MIFRVLGPPAVKFAVVYLRRRYSTQLRIGVGLTVVAVGVAAYLASRNVPEG